MKQDSERQRGLDREIRIASLRASAVLSARNPTVNGVFAEPDHDVAPITEPLLVLRPVLDLVFRLVFRVYETGRACCYRMSSFEFAG